MNEQELFRIHLFEILDNRNPDLFNIYVVNGMELARILLFLFLFILDFILDKEFLGKAYQLCLYDNIGLFYLIKLMHPIHTNFLDIFLIVKSKHETNRLIAVRFVPRQLLLLHSMYGVFALLHLPISDFQLSFILDYIVLSPFLAVHCHHVDDIILELELDIQYLLYVLPVPY